MTEAKPELIGQYVARPEPGMWECLACTATAKALGYRGRSASGVYDREKHTAWHERRQGTAR